MKSEGTKHKTLFFCMIILSALLIVTGVVQQQPDSVFAKAAAVCLECVGIG